MKSLYLNSDNGDIEFNELGELKMVDNIKEIGQRNEIGLSINQGEWIFDMLLGLPWIEMLSDKDTSQQDIKNLVKEELLKDDDIAEVTEIEADFTGEDRTLYIKFNAKLIDGEELEGEVEV